MPKQKRKDLHLLLLEKDYNLLKDLSEKTGYSVTWIIRHSINYYLVKKGIKNEN